MLEKASQKIIVVVGVLAVLAGFGYYAFTTSQIEATDEEVIQQSTIGQDIIILAEKINRVNIDENIFTSAVFMSLIDRDFAISPESQGRTNPFANIGVEGGSGVAVSPR